MKGMPHHHYVDIGKLLKFTWFSSLYHTTYSLMHKSLIDSFDKQMNGTFIFIGYIDFSLWPPDYQPQTSSDFYSYYLVKVNCSNYSSVGLLPMVRDWNQEVQRETLKPLRSKWTLDIYKTPGDGYGSCGSCKVCCCTKHKLRLDSENVG